MDRLACVNVAALPLQILLRMHPAWARFPVAVVEEERPQALVLCVNALARKSGIRTGQRYAVALSLANTLQAGVVSPLQIQEMVRTITDFLRRYSPEIEPSANLPGVFWLDARGLERLYPSLGAWADAVRGGLRTIRMRATVAVGCSHFGAYALAVSQRGVVVCEGAEEEREKILRIPLARLNLSPDARDRLQQLGVITMEDFLQLPAEGIASRFGAETDAVYQLAAGYRWSPLLPVAARKVHQQVVHFDAPENNSERLLFIVKRMLDSFVAKLAAEFQSITEVSLEMKLDDRTRKAECVRPAAATLDVAQLLALIYLRLNAMQLSAGIVTLRVMLKTSAASAEQCQLFRERRRDAEEADQALARVRAEFGESAVVHAEICNAHLPSGRFAWKPLGQSLPMGKAHVVASRPLMRRIYAQHLSLRRDVLENPAQERQGPYVLSGGWWAGGTHRDYYYMRTDDGRLLWLYYDARKKQFFLQGQVE